MGMLDKEPYANTDQEPGVLDLPHASSPRPVPCNDARGRVLPITPEEQARDAEAIAAFVELMYALPDDDPPGAGKRPCAISMPIDRTGSSSRVSISLGAADPTA